MTHKSLVDGFSDSYLKDTIEKEGRERQGTDTSGSGRKNWGWDGEKLGGEVCVCVCVCWGEECGRNKNSRSRDGFLIQVLKMCWSHIFQRVLGWKKSFVIQDCWSCIHAAWQKCRLPHWTMILSCTVRGICYSWDCRTFQGLCMQPCDLLASKAYAVGSQ